MLIIVFHFSMKSLANLFDNVEAFQDFQAGEPNNAGFSGENCVILPSSEGEGWHDVSCLWHGRAICELPEQNCSTINGG